METEMFRVKVLLGDKLKKRASCARQGEAYLRLGAMNKMKGSGIPSYSC